MKVLLFPTTFPRSIRSQIGTAAAAASIRTTSSASNSIPVAMPVHPRFSHFNRVVRNSGFDRTLPQPRSPSESHRSWLVSRSQFDSRSGDVVYRSDYSRAGKRLTTVTFHTPKDSEDGDGDNYSSPRSVATELVGSLVAVSAWVRNTKRWICSRCGNSNRLKEKEACLVCDARYYSNCVLKAMRCVTS